jgi:hypothetical protein
VQNCEQRTDGFGNTTTSCSFGTDN